MYGCAATLATAVVLAKQFYRVKPVAGYLLWPYVAFLTFANALNFFHLKNNSVRFYPTFLPSRVVVLCRASLVTYRGMKGYLWAKGQEFNWGLGITWY